MATATELSENELSYQIIGMAINVHKTLGPGLLESVYETALTNDLTELDLRMETQVGPPFVYKGILMEWGFRIDIVVNEKVAIEIKSVEDINEVLLKYWLN